MGEKEKSQEFVMVGSGTLFRFRQAGKLTDKTAVIIEEINVITRTFECAILHTDETGVYFGGVGTQGGDEWGGFAGRMELQDFIEAAKNSRLHGKLPPLSQVDIKKYEKLYRMRMKKFPIIRQYYP